MEVTDLCESFEELAEGPGDDIEGIIGKLDKGIYGTLGGWIALDHVQGEARVDRQLRGDIFGRGKTREEVDGPCSLFC